MRRGFTLIELLTIVAIIAIMVTASVASVRSGQGAARTKAAARDVFASIRHARSTALVTQQPCIITYSTKVVGDEPCASVEVNSAQVLSFKGAYRAETLEGGSVVVGGDEADLGAQDGEGGKGGQSLEEILFAPVSEDVVRGMRLKVLREGDELASVERSRARPKISVFSNVDYLIGRYNSAKAEAEKKKDEEKKQDESSESSSLSSGDDGPVSVVWEVNGRTEPHRVYVYADGRRPEDGLCISIDRFGAAKVLTGDER